MNCENNARIDRAVSRLFLFGTKVATGVIAAGCVVQLAAPYFRFAPDLYWLGVAIFILLPIAGVVMMSFLFIRQRRHVLGAVAAGVFVITAAGSVMAALAGR
jgi:hypothetical protein